MRANPHGNMAALIINPLVYTIAVSAQSFTTRYGSSKECNARPDRATHTSACLHIPHAKRPRLLFFTALVKLRISECLAPSVPSVFVVFSSPFFVCISLLFILLRSINFDGSRVYPSAWGITTELGNSGDSFGNLRPTSVPTQVDRSYGNRTPLVRPSGWAYRQPHPSQSYFGKGNDRKHLNVDTLDVLSVSTDLENPEAQPSAWLGTTTKWYLGSLLTSYIQPFENFGKPSGDHSPPGQT